MEEKNKPYHHKNLRSELIENGIKLVGEEGGVNGISLRKAAKLCCVSHTAPYSHFRTKEELLAAMQNHITDKFTECLEEAINNVDCDYGVLERLGKAYVKFFIRNKNYFIFLFGHSNIKIDLTSTNCDETNYKPLELFKQELFKLMENYGAIKDNKKDVVIAFWAFIHGITSISSMNNVIYNENWEEKVVDYMRIFKW